MSHVGWIQVTMFVTLVPTRFGRLHIEVAWQAPCLRLVLVNSDLTTWYQKLWWGNAWFSRPILATKTYPGAGEQPHGLVGHIINILGCIYNKWIFIFWVVLIVNITMGISWGLQQDSFIIFTTKYVVVNPMISPCSWVNPGEPYRKSFDFQVNRGLKGLPTVDTQKQLDRVGSCLAMLLMGWIMG